MKHPFNHVYKIIFIFIISCLTACSKSDDIGYATPIQFEYTGIEVNIMSKFDRSAHLPSEGGKFSISYFGKRAHMTMIEDLSINGIYEPLDSKNIEDETSFPYIISFSDREWGWAKSECPTNNECINSFFINKNTTGAPREFIINFGCCNSYLTLNIYQE